MVGDHWPLSHMEVLTESQPGSVGEKANPLSKCTQSKNINKYNNQLTFIYLFNPLPHNPDF